MLAVVVRAMLARRNNAFAFVRCAGSVSSDQRRDRSNGMVAIAAAVAAGSICYVAWKERRRRGPLAVSAEATPGSEAVVARAGKRLAGLPDIRLEQVRGHDAPEKRVWVTYKEGVYDITEFLSKHPGSAKNLLMAAGGSVEPFWEIYAVHKANPQVLELIELYRIGNVDPHDLATASEVEADPFINEPQRHPALRQVSQKPFNAETPSPLLVQEFYTPNKLFYVRSHLPTPDLSMDAYELELTGLGLKQEKVLGMKDLKSLQKHSVTAAIQCGGNRRTEMNQVRPLKGLSWTSGAIGNAVWSGVYLRDVLAAHGFDADKAESAGAQHVHFEGYDLNADGSPFAASIPLSLVLDPKREVLLAFEMNGEPLPRDHGFPLRLVVPGVVGVRNVKWVNRIIISDKESDSHWQQGDYKGFNPSIDWHNVDFSKSPPIMDMPVTSAICVPESGHKASRRQKFVDVKGYAWSGGGNKILRVDLSIDSGKNWFEADLTEQEDKPAGKHFGWTLWKARIELPEKEDSFEIWSKAVDSTYNVQPETFANIWNLRGLLSNAYSRVKVIIEK